MYIGIDLSSDTIKELKLDLSKLHLLYLVNDNLNQKFNMKIPQVLKSNIVEYVPCDKRSFKNVLSESAEYYLNIVWAFYYDFMTTSYVNKKNVHSRIIQALIVQQLKISGAILQMSQHNVFGQYTLLRSLLESYITMEWLLNSNSKSKINKNNPFILYEYSGLFNLKRIHNRIQKKRKSNNYFPNNVLYKIDRRILRNDLKILIQTDWPCKKIRRFLHKSNSKIRSEYGMPNVHDMMAYASPNGKLNIKHIVNTADIYRTLCREVHSDFSDIIPKNTRVEKNTSYIYDGTKHKDGVFNYGSINFLNCPSLIWSTLLLIESFISIYHKHILPHYSIFMYIQKLFIFIYKNISMVDHVYISCNFANKCILLNIDKEYISPKRMI